MKLPRGDHAEVTPIPPEGLCEIDKMHVVDHNMIYYYMPRPKKNIVCFRFPTDPVKTCATQIYFMDFKKKKKNFFFFF